jgi:S-phase kinase-associated protein 1
MSTVTLVSSDKHTFTVDKKAAELSVLLRNLLEDIDQAESTPIPLPNVSGKTLAKIIEYCTHHKDTPPLDDENDKDTFDPNSPKNTNIISDWDAAFVGVDNDELFEIILAANYLDIKGCLDLGCKTVAAMIKGKTPQQIRDLFNIENDFSPEEEEQIRKENEWAAEV